MLYEAETRKRIEEAFDIINDYTIDLYYLSIRNEIKHYVDFVACWNCLDDLKCAYREIVEKMKTQSCRRENANYVLDNKWIVWTHRRDFRRVATH